MKKTYINPTINVVYISPSTMIAESELFGEETAGEQYGGWVKENRYRRNRWDDDWDE